MGREAEKIILFEHINTHGINPYDEFLELKNTMGILETVEARGYSVVDTQ